MTSHRTSSTSFAGRVDFSGPERRPCGLEMEQRRKLNQEGKPLQMSQPAERFVSAPPLYCPGCGTQAQSGARFCGECGLGMGKHRWDLPEEELSPIEAKILESMTATTYAFCPTCGNETEPWFLFCGECGRSVIKSVQLREQVTSGGPAEANGRSKSSSGRCGPSRREVMSSR